MTHPLLRLLFTAAPTPPDAAGLLAEAHAAKVVPHFANRLPRPIPPAVRDAATRSFLASSRIANAGIDALDILARHNIPAAAFKGLAAAALLYNGPAERTLQDTDLLIEPAAIPAAVDALSAAGFRPDIPAGVNDYIHFVRNSPGFSGNLAISLFSPQNTEIDLHWRLGPFDTRALLARRLAHPLLGRTVPLLAIPELALLTVHHSLRNNFHPQAILRDLLDFHRWLALCPLPDLLPPARLHGLEQPVFAMVNILRRLGVEHLPVAPPTPLEELFFHQLAAGPLNKDLLLLLSPAAWAQLLRGAAGGWRSYRRHMEAYETRGGHRTVSLASRVASLTHAARQLSPAQWRQLHALRRAKSPHTP